MKVQILVEALNSPPPSIPGTTCTPVAEKINVRKRKNAVDKFEKMEEFVEKVMKF